MSTIPVHDFTNSPRPPAPVPYPYHRIVYSAYACAVWGYPYHLGYSFPDASAFPSITITGRCVSTSFHHARASLRGQSYLLGSAVRAAAAPRPLLRPLRKAHAACSSCGLAAVQAHPCNLHRRRAFANYKAGIWQSCAAAFRLQPSTRCYWLTTGFASGWSKWRRSLRTWRWKMWLT